MPEEKYEVKTFIIRYVCDKCGIGNMLVVPAMVRCYGPNCTNLHRCNHCKHEQRITGQYPKTVNERVVAPVEYEGKMWNKNDFSDEPKQWESIEVAERRQEIKDGFNRANFKVE